LAPLQRRRNFKTSRGCCFAWKEDKADDHSGPNGIVPGGPTSSADVEIESLRNRRSPACKRIGAASPRSEEVQVRVPSNPEDSHTARLAREPAEDDQWQFIRLTYSNIVGWIWIRLEDSDLEFMILTTESRLTVVSRVSTVDYLLQCLGSRRSIEHF
jgi:hypothetical protein